MSQIKLIDRILLFDLSCVPALITIERENPYTGKMSVRHYSKYTDASGDRFQRLINQPGIDPTVNLVMQTLEYYFLRNMIIDDPVITEGIDEKVEVNGQTYQIPY